MTSIEEKTCKFCGESKPLTSDYFFRKHSTPDGFDRLCKSCQPLYRLWLKEREVAPIDPTIKTCNKCGETKPATTEFFTPRRQTQLSGECKECRRRRRRADPEVGAVVLPHFCSACWVEKPTRAFGNVSLVGVARTLVCLECRTKMPPHPNLTTRRANDAAQDGFKCCSACGEIKPATREYFYTGPARYGLKSTCIECSKAYTMTPNYRQRMKEKYDADPEPFRARAKLQAERAKEEDFLGFLQRTREAGKRWREAHPEEAKANGRMSQHKRRWQKHNQTEGEHYAWKDVERMLEEQEGCCIYCEVELQEYHVDHVVSLAKGGSNSAENLVIACPLCNLSKNDKSLEEWINRPTKEQSELWYADPTKGRSGRPKK